MQLASSSCRVNDLVLLLQQDEAFMAALVMGVPEWANAQLLQPNSLPGSSTGGGASHFSSGPGTAQAAVPLSVLLRPFPEEQLQLGQELDVGTNDECAVYRGTIRGGPAVIKHYRLTSPEEALKAAAEVRINITVCASLAARPGAQLARQHQTSLLSRLCCTFHCSKCCPPMSHI
jgi:hypothetical protein